jgi:hypothetical protein
MDDATALRVVISVFLGDRLRGLSRRVPLSALSITLKPAMLKYPAVITISELNNSQGGAASLLWALISPARIYANFWFRWSRCF